MLVLLHSLSFIHISHPRAAAATRARTQMLSEDLAVRLASKGFAIPGMEDVARTAKTEAATRAAAACTYESPCDFDWIGFGTSLAVSPFSVGALALVFYLAGASAADEDGSESYLAALESRAQESRARRDAQLRSFAARLSPLQELLGWDLVDSAGMPLANAWLFLAAALLVQVSLAVALWPR